MRDLSIIPVILSGGSGSRLWPLSRQQRPKQFLDLGFEECLFSETIARVNNPSFNFPVVICNEDHRFLVAEKLREKNCDSQIILLEPCSKNTAPAVAAAVNFILSVEKDSLVLVLPSDHKIGNTDALINAVRKSKYFAESGQIVSFGIKPEWAETGYGYIKKGSRIENSKETYEIMSFEEKPDRLTAEGYLESGGYCWNSGILLFKPEVFIEELEKFAPEVLNSVNVAYDRGIRDKDFYWLDNKAFNSVPPISIDYAILEKTNRAIVVELDMNWSDVGGWAAISRLVKPDRNNNTINGDASLIDCTGVFANSEGPLIAALGVHDLILVATKDAFLVIPKDKSNEVSQIVSCLKHSGRSEYDKHEKVYRPWGNYQNLHTGKKFLVKEIVVNPGAKLSL